MSETTRKTPRSRKPKQLLTSSPALSMLTRDNLETSMIRWAFTREGPIAGRAIVELIGGGAVLDALESVAESMQSMPNIFDDDVAMVQTAWLNYQNFGSPGFPVSSASNVRDYMQSAITEVEIDDDYGE